MQKKKMRLGSISILFALIMLCVIILSVLSVMTARADMAVAAKYADQVMQSYQIDAKAEQWLADTDAALMKNGNEMTAEALSESAVIEGDEISVSIAEEKQSIDIRLKMTNDEKRYQIIEWKNYSVWEEDTTMNLWQPE